MRISDWSSDVCSSDLVGAKNMAEPRKVTLGAMQGGNWVIQEGLRPGDRVIVSGLQKVQLGQPVRIAKPRSPGSAAKPQPADRKSVVSGKGVSVRVDLGGRRIIKKKQTNESNTE